MSNSKPQPDSSSSAGAVTKAIENLRRQANTDEAAAAIVTHYWRRTIGLARAKIQLQDIRGRVGASDIAVDSLQALLAKLQQGAYEWAQDREDFWKLLAVFTSNSVNDARKHFEAVKRGGKLVRGESALPTNSDGAPMRLDEYVEDPTDDEANEAGDRLVEALEVMTPEEGSLVASVAVLGTSETAKRMGISVRTVQHRLQLIRARIQKKFY